ncbi:MAG: glycosyl hydrolase, partial [bacterium]|nr:glycosyl hydrolase [bacterium]
ALRNVDEQVLGEEATLFPVKDPLMYIQSRPLGWGEKGTLGHGLYTALNPPFGAVFTYYLRDSLKSKKETRRGAEHKAAADGESVSIPGWDELREEDTEEAPSVQLVVEDSSGTVVRRLDADVAAGFHRVAWDLRWPTLGPVASTDEDDSGPMVAPGTFTVRLVRRVGGVAQPLSEPQAFEAVPLGIASLPAEDRQDLVNFHLVSADLQRAVLGTAAATRDAGERIATLKRTIQISPGSDEEMAAQIREIEARLNNLRTTLFGDQTVARRQHPTMPSIVDRVERVMEAHWSSTSAATKTHLRNYKIAATAFESLLAELRQLLEVDLTNLEGRLEKAGVNWTPGRRLPIWEPMPFAMKGGR